jgi:hypothetical protein
MAASNDPVGSGFVESLGRPGHNITGVSILSTDLSGKLVEMLQSVAPTATRVAILLNPRNSSNAAIAINLQVAMQGARLTGQPVEAATAEGIEQAFARMQGQDASAVVVAADSFFVEQRQQIAQLALNLLHLLTAGPGTQRKCWRVRILGDSWRVSGPRGKAVRIERLQNLSLPVGRERRIAAVMTTARAWSMFSRLASAASASADPDRAIRPSNTAHSSSAIGDTASITSSDGSSRSRDLSLPRASSFPIRPSAQAADVATRWSRSSRRSIKSRIS